MDDKANDDGRNTEIPFNKQMRLATREVHAISDALVNAKLAFALSENSVWADGLLVFYEVFRFLEGAMTRLRNSHVGSICIDGILRTEAFEKDLAFYLGPDWNKNYIPRESVTKYLIHLQKLEENDPIRLIAYIYHLYMGLLSGGQILSKKRKVFAGFSLFTQGDNVEGYAVTNFGNKKIYELKKEMIRAVNEIAEELDTNEKHSIIEESKIVFQLNNSIIKSVKNANYVFIKKVLLYIIIIFIIIYIYCKLR